MVNHRLKILKNLGLMYQTFLKQNETVFERSPVFERSHMAGGHGFEP